MTDIILLGLVICVMIGISIVVIAAIVYALCALFLYLAGDLWERQSQARKIKKGDGNNGEN